MIVFATPDDGLRRRLMHALSADDTVVYCSSKGVLERAADSGVSFAVLDCRASSDASSVLAANRLEPGALPRCVGIAPSDAFGRTRIVTAAGTQVLDAVIPATDIVADVVRAHINDPTKSIAGATSLELLLRLLPNSTHTTLCLVIGSGFRIGMVKQLAAYHHKERSSISKSHRAESQWTPTSLINLAKATYAMVLLEEVELSIEAAAEALGYRKESSLDELLLRVFDIRWPEAHAELQSAGLIAWLEIRIAQIDPRRGRADDRLSPG